jgi:hypothetical protein
MAAAFSAATLFISEALPFCDGVPPGQSLGSIRAPPANNQIWTHLPLGELELGLATALGDDALVLLQAAADGTGRNGEVAVVAIRGKYVSQARSARRGLRARRVAGVSGEHT